MRKQQAFVVVHNIRMQCGFFFSFFGWSGSMPYCSIDSLLLLPILFKLFKELGAGWRTVAGRWSLAVGVRSSGFASPKSNFVWSGWTKVLLGQFFSGYHKCGKYSLFIDEKPKLKRIRQLKGKENWRFAKNGICFAKLYFSK